MPKIYQVDAFTSKAFRGNPAGVCLLDEPANEQWMQNVAAEMNLSETAFLVPQENGYELRWFTPATEVDLCGHATLASAHILFETETLSAAQPAVFFSKSGKLTVTHHEHHLEMDFPAEPPEEIAPPPSLLKALGVYPVASARNRMDVLLHLKTPDEVLSARPDFTALAQVPVRGVMITSESNDKNYDFISRFFAPAEGINEDPVTGSAHCCLGPYWQQKIGKSDFKAYQASARGGEIGVQVKGDRVLLTGSAVTVFRGELVV